MIQAHSIRPRCVPLLVGRNRWRALFCATGPSARRLRQWSGGAMLTRGGCFSACKLHRIINSALHGGCLFLQRGSVRKGHMRAHVHQSFRTTLALACLKNLDYVPLRGPPNERTSERGQQTDGRFLLDELDTARHKLLLQLRDLMASVARPPLCAGHPVPCYCCCCRL